MGRFIRALLGLLALLLVLVSFLGLYGVTRDEPHAFEPERLPGLGVGEVLPLVPGPGLPAGVEIQGSTNNLDAARFEGLFFLAVRTAPHHFATDEARLLIFSSPDRSDWRLEHEIDLPRSDLREPRFLAFRGTLRLYFVELGDDPFAFKPRWIHVTERGADGAWSASERIFEEGHIVWRLREHAGLAWMSVYHGAELYEDFGNSGSVRLLVSEDGRNFHSVSGEASPIDAIGPSECAFDFAEDGSLVALVRIESRGSLVCTAPATRLDRWDCTPTGYRHDSPLIVQEGGRFFAIARRSLSGPFPAGGWLPERLALAWSLVRYSATRKRTAIYEILPEERRTVLLADLPSQGDTAFAASVPLGEGRHWVANYTSPLDGRDLPWFFGQLLGSVVVGFDVDLGIRRDERASADVVP